MFSKILLLDIETAPNMGWIWALCQENRNMDMIEHEWYILCWCAKWLGDDTIQTCCLPQFDLYKTNPTDDTQAMLRLHALLDEADVVVAHNAIKFDVKRINTRFVINGIKPPSPYKVLDTLRVARQHFAFTSNKLDDLGRLLNLGRKKDTGGFKLWQDCMNGDMEAWHKMVAYCAGDVELLEAVYNCLLPYATNTPNLAIRANAFVCPKCGSDSLERRGVAHTNAASYQRWRCNDCGGWSRERTAIADRMKTLAGI